MYLISCAQLSTSRVDSRVGQDLLWKVSETKSCKIYVIIVIFVTGQGWVVSHLLLGWILCVQLWICDILHKLNNWTTTTNNNIYFAKSNII